MKVPLAVGLLLLTACAGHVEMAVLGSIPDFELISQKGTAFRGSSLRGHVWVADFIYTNCPGPCPMMSSRMRRIAQLTSSEPSIQFVSFTVDPARDTPPTLDAYAKQFDITHGRWTFLTGDSKTLQMLDHDAFHLGNLDASFDHSTRFAVVDGQSRIRAYYRMSDENMAARVASDAKFLAKEKS